MNAARDSSARGTKTKAASPSDGKNDFFCFKERTFYNKLGRHQIGAAKCLLHGADPPQRGAPHESQTASNVSQSQNCAPIDNEATGFQRDRTKDALSRILEAFIAKELQPFLRAFPAEFYQEMFRLRGMEYPNATVQRPRYFGVLTNDIIYDRLAPGVLEELKKVNPKDEMTGRRKHKHFRWLTSNIGYPKLREHLGAVVATMRLSNDWHDFKAKLDKNYPRIGKPTQLSMEFADDEVDTGKGL